GRGDQFARGRVGAHEAAEAGGVAGAGDAEQALGLLADGLHLAAHRLATALLIRSCSWVPALTASVHSFLRCLSKRYEEGMAPGLTTGSGRSLRASRRFSPSGSCWTLSCSLRMASRSISGRGGHPGRYMSTGTTWSTPWTMA